MTIHEFLREKTALLSAARITSARLDCLVLMEDVLGNDRAHLLANPELKLEPEWLDTLNKLMRRRITQEPLAYIRNRVEFYGRSFYVDKRVLVPRPETETMIDLLKQLPLPAEPVIADIGTGSGVLAITAALELPHAKAYGFDIDAGCLAVARNNAQRHAVNPTFLLGDLLQPLKANRISPDVLLCNLPYVPDGFAINQAAKYEPRIALFAGNHGLDLYRRLFDEINRSQMQPSFVLTEAMPEQHAALLNIAQNSSYRILKTHDLIQIFALS